MRNGEQLRVFALFHSIYLRATQSLRQAYEHYKNSPDRTEPSLAPELSYIAQFKSVLLRAVLPLNSQYLFIGIFCKRCLKFSYKWNGLQNMSIRKKEKFNIDWSECPFCLSVQLSLQLPNYHLKAKSLSVKTLIAY